MVFRRHSPQAFFTSVRKEEKKAEQGEDDEEREGGKRATEANRSWFSLPSRRRKRE
jgi:hypothetical protein